MKIRNINKTILALAAGATVFMVAKSSMPKDIHANMNLDTTNTAVSDVTTGDEKLTNDEGVPLDAFEIVDVPEVDSTTSEEYYPYQIYPAIISTTDLNVRESDSTNSNIIGCLTPGTKLEKLEDVGDWDKIDYYGRVAYVHNDYTEDSYMVKGTPTNVIYSDYEVTFTDKETGSIKTLKPYEVMFVYYSEPDRLLVYADGRLGYVENREYNNLTGTYTIVDISDQRLDLYKDNQLIMSTPVTTGRDGMETKVGSFQVQSEIHDGYLVGPGYKSPVYDFYAFYGGQGLHDARWRDLFGGSFYHESGSHGCVNMPIPAAGIVSDYFEEAQDNYETPKILVKQ